MKGTRHTALAALVGLLACGSEAPPEGPITADILHYDYSFDLESRAAISKLTLSIVEPGNCITLSLRATALSNVTFDGEPAVSGQLIGDSVEVCGRGWDTGEQVVVSADIIVPEQTWDDSQVGYSVWEDLEGNPFSYMVSWIDGCDRFGLCDARPSVFATFRFTVTHPSGTDVLCPGVLTAGDTMTTCEFDYAGGPTYSTFGLVASPSWSVTDLGNWSGIDVTLYDMPSSGVAAAIDVDYASGFLRWMIDRFGPYPYGNELRLAVGPTYWNGFEHPGNIVLNDQLPVAQSAYTKPLGHSLNHEVAHMWAGNQTTLANTYDFVWKEAMVEYLSFAYDDEVDASVAATTAWAWKQFSRFAEFYPVPGEQPPLLEYYGDVYGPGAVVLFRQLEAIFDRDSVLQAIATLLGSQRVISIADVQTALEETLAVDLDDYFSRWVHGSGVPVYPQFDMSYVDNGDGTIDITVAQKDAANGLWGTAFYIGIRGTAGEQENVFFNLGIEGAASMTNTVPIAFEINFLVFDSLSHTLATGTDITSSAAPAPRTLPRDLAAQPWVAPTAPVVFQR